MRRQSNSSTSKGDDGSEESPKRKRRSCAVVATQRIQTAFNLNNANKERRSMSRESDELPNCVLQLNDRCLKNAAGGQLITKKEYVCGLCCTALWQKSSNYGYYEWKRKYEQESRCRVTIKAFIQDQILDYWVKCVECSKWRAAPSEDTFRLNDITTFLCDDCTEPQDEVFESIRDDMRWHNSLSVLPYLQNNPVKLYLKKDYFLEEIGLSPTENSGEVEFKLNGYRRDTSAFLKPFHAPQEAAIAFCMRPDCMEYDEKVDFKSFAHEPRPYLAVRNLVIALWNIAPFRFLTLEDCARHLICRGHSRIYLITQLLPKVHWYLMRKGLINYGVINVPLRLRFVSPQLVVVIGGGISGICVTRQLNCMGINARLYEGKSDLGGRMRDETTLGVPVGRGAQLVVGIVNNPITLMCEQIGASYRCTNKNCPMIDADRGLTIKKEDDNIVDVHFNKMLDLLFKWKKTHKRRDASLEGSLLD